MTTACLVPLAGSATLLFSVGLLVAGCGSGSSVPPTAPTSTASPAPVPPRPDPGLVAGERWNLTTTLTSLSGPEVCWAPRTNIGRSIDWLMAIQRSGQSIHLLYDVRNYPSDHVEHVGTVVANDFTASSESWPGSFMCGEARSDYRFEANVSGRFSADGRTLTAAEVWSYRLTSGETVSFHFDWNATKQ